ncbi:MAG: class I SAM-dependent methyltransferase [Candidatus Latescibacterota bacterium]|jgi:trans-aconitate methyltransferase
MARDFHSREGVDEWLDSLDERWPQRNQLTQHIAEQVGKLPFAKPEVIELCCGGGRLAEKLLSTRPALIYSGVDFSAALLDSARIALAAHTQRITLLQTDLNEDSWLTQVKVPAHAIFSMQSLHDLGDEPQVERIYAKSLPLLHPGGFLLNADFHHNPDDPRPGRLSTERHIQLLKKHGYQRVETTLITDGFSCSIGFA